jgi:ubiquinone/menaquinone biosynthesis C-methylase UbiE
MFPFLYDAIFAFPERLGLRRVRRRLIESVSGDVLEIGGGTGLNLPLYPPSARLVFTDPDVAMLARARTRLTSARCSVTMVAADAQRLPFADAAFDHVIVTLAFCTIPNPVAAFAEIRRVLRPGGVLRLLEHVRSARGWIGRLQDFATPVWKHLADGCHLNRRTLETALAGGFTALSVRPSLDGWLIAELQPKSE